MKKNIGTRLLIIIATLLIFMFGIFGVPKSFSKDGLLSAMGERINLGLDLRGGTHLILQVMVDEAIGNEAERSISQLKDQLAANNLSYTNISRPNPTDQPDRISITGMPPESAGTLREVVSEWLPQYDLVSGPDNSWVLNMKLQALNDAKNRAVTRSIETIRQRVDSLGVTEPIIQEHGLGEHQILVQLPGVDDPARVKEIIQATGMLEIKQVLGDSAGYASEQEAIQAMSGLPNAMIVRGRAEGGEPPRIYIVSRTPAIAGDDLKEAQVGRDQFNKPNVNFFLTSDGGRRFGVFTAANVGNYLAVVLEGKVRSVARIESEIGDTGQISGNFTEQEAKDLETVLDSGSLPASIRYLEERTVGPSLGADSIRDGVRAGVTGLVLVLIFMLIYYKGAGINANLGLILNLVVLLGFLGFTNATLTLPGIAGVILTIGMGVDSNVLIFERIREELRAGKTAAAAVDQGFSRAWLTIVDTHVTTIVSALILFVFGTGPVRGFAVTLAFGLAANLFTAVFVSRVIFDWVLSRKRTGEALSI